MEGIAIVYHPPSIVKASGSLALLVAILMLDA
jgi:hypothetical protein